MLKFLIVFKKTFYATETITAKTKGEADHIAQKIMAQDEDTDGRTLDWNNYPTYKVVVNDLGEEHHD